MGKSHVQEAIAKVRQGFDQRDPAVLARAYAENAVMQSSGEPPMHGREAIEQSCRINFAAFPDISVDFLNILVMGDRACIEFRTSGTHTGVLSTPQGDLEPTGRRVDFRGAFLMRVNAKGEIEEDHTYYDTAEFAEQLGIGK